MPDPGHAYIVANCSTCARIATSVGKRSTRAIEAVATLGAGEHIGRIRGMAIGPPWPGDTIRFALRSASEHLFSAATGRRLPDADA
ncbi:hypothetical protein [Rhizobium anhuiense]|uniref:hypothetical protein n=1 Tax=Rhizobium anhuiense TaxID=1184720 RepID=UPI0013E0404D|nr:hypothetical protein [Rhizobium anhuiense]GGD67642.1 hypothetical protein GCM10008012_09930 [Rhizobium anhuiense]